ncbi:Gamma-glutamyl hydrolase [Seminavis robusta]|uniref:folate gamma-glutamyl hydrolase n=1 Tax=Seminavis robusta TaxID=568900 RepID=A0A9N8HYQ0_9STRA|nr:Gamma-glutamyl hydrolase [Seminavis robusta]|eukprot:Sro2597_g332140.1 Gamma-glutamyl hydrolase (344) ;mRNA; r:271-1302
MLWSSCVALSFGLSVNAAISVSAQQTSSPVIGILSQPIGLRKTDQNTEQKEEYVIAASYVKWLESGGARSIPIPYDAGPGMVKDLFGQINGLLLPGGGSAVPPAVHQLLNLALDESFPVWGTCLGFEYLVQVLSSNSSLPVLTDGFDAENNSWPLLNVQRRQLYQDDRIYQIVRQKNVTSNSHHMGVEPSAFRNNENLNKLFEVTSVNVDGHGRPFVSTIEPRNPHIMPIYGVQYHPEKNAFEYGTYAGTNIPYKAIDHSEEAVEFSAYVARFFVRLVKAHNDNNHDGSSVHRHHSYTKHRQYPLVQTYPVKQMLAFEQYYVIPSAKQLDKTIKQSASKLLRG